MQLSQATATVRTPVRFQKRRLIVNAKYFVLQDAYPCRTKGMFLYNEPPIFDPILAVMKQFMKPKLKKRVSSVQPWDKQTSCYRSIE